jgi:hypothetical protein
MQNVVRNIAYLVFQDVNSFYYFTFFWIRKESETPKGEQTAQSKAQEENWSQHTSEFMPPAKKKTGRSAS